MTDALIGSTGFVGGTLMRAHAFEVAVHAPNVTDGAGGVFDLLVIAGAPAAKWLANAHPEEDARNLQRLMAALSDVTAQRAVLISTIDVYPRPIVVDESTRLPTDAAEA